MLRTLIVDFLLPIVLILLLRSVLRGLFAPKLPQRARPSEPQSPPPNELKKDPVCGTYVSTAVALRETIKGQTIYFCSTACRDKYHP